jgi:hypothetical protein
MSRPAPLAAALLLAGCAGLGAPSALPTLALLPDPPRPAVAAPASGRSVAVSALSLPAYADRAGVARVGPDGRAAQSVDEQWGDPLGRAATLAFARALAERTGALALAEPWPPEFAPDARVDVIVTRLIADADTLRFDGEYRVATARGPALAAARRFAITAPVAGPGLDALGAAHAAALAALAEEVAPTLGR